MSNICSTYICLIHIICLRLCINSLLFLFSAKDHLYHLITLRTIVIQNMALRRKKKTKKTCINLRFSHFCEEKKQNKNLSGKSKEHLNILNL